MPVRVMWSKRKAAASQNEKTTRGPIHKYVGLIGLSQVCFLCMGLSGILLNHPSADPAVFVPLAWAPPSYHYARGH